MNLVRFVWNNAGLLMLVFAILAFLTSGLFSREADTHNDQMRREALDRLEAESNGEIHEPFDAPEGMQPATQYEPIRTRRIDPTPALAVEKVLASEPQTHPM